VNKKFHDFETAILSHAVAESLGKAPQVGGNSINARPGNEFPIKGRRGGGICIGVIFSQKKKKGGEGQYNQKSAKPPQFTCRGKRRPWGRESKLPTYEFKILGQQPFPAGSNKEKEKDSQKTKKPPTISVP